MHESLKRHPKRAAILLAVVVGGLHQLARPYPTLRFYLLCASIIVLVAVVGLLVWLLWPPQSTSNKHRASAARPRFDDEIRRSPTCDERRE